MPHEKPAFGQILLVILPEVPLTGPSLSNALLHRPYGGQIPRADKYRTVNIMLQQMLREVTPAACLPDNHLHQTVQRAGVIPGQANAEIRFQFQQACKSRTYEIRQVILSEADKHIAAVHLRLHLHPPVLGGRADGHQMERVDTPDHSRHPVHRDRRDLHNLRPTVAGMYNYVQPVVACIVAICCGMESLNLIKAAAVVLIFTGVYLVTASKSRQDLENHDADKTPVRNP